MATPVIITVPTQGDKWITKLEFMNRFSDQELCDLYAAESYDIQIRVWLKKFEFALVRPDGTAIDLYSPQTAGGLAMLEAKGIISAGRAGKIISGGV